MRVAILATHSGLMNPEKLVTLLGNDMRQLCSVASYICFDLVVIVFGCKAFF
jgi:hypothetical protein